MSELTIRRATVADMDGINKLLHQVLMVHHNGRPDLFKPNAKKYTDDELTAIISDDTRPIFVAVDEKPIRINMTFTMSKPITR